MQINKDMLPDKNKGYCKLIYCSDEKKDLIQMKKELFNLTENCLL